MKTILIAMAAAFPFSAYAWGTAGVTNYYQAAQQGALMQAQITATNAYTACMQSGGNCATPPVMTYQPPPAPVYTPPQQCHEYCYQSGPNRYCNSQCY
jgi:hypothetical protein